LPFKFRKTKINKTIKINLVAHVNKKRGKPKYRLVNPGRTKKFDCKEDKLKFFKIKLKSQEK
jgi:hypothetical protein